MLKYTNGPIKNAVKLNKKGSVVNECVINYEGCFTGTVLKG